jgi:hypothetical protein
MKIVINILLFMLILPLLPLLLLRPVRRKVASALTIK